MKKIYKDYDEIMKDFGKDIFIIEYPFNWGGQIQDRRWWCALDMETGNAYDYHTKGTLKHDLNNEGKKWIVVRWHKRNKGVSVVECSLNLNKPTMIKNQKKSKLNQSGGEK